MSDVLTRFRIKRIAIHRRDLMVAFHHSTKVTKESNSLVSFHLALVARRIIAGRRWISQRKKMIYECLRRQVRKEDEEEGPRKALFALKSIVRSKGANSQVSPKFPRSTEEI